MKPLQPNYKNDFRNISEILKAISKDISDIKRVLNIEDELVSKEYKDKLYPWNLPNTTTSADYESED